jgi:glycyl-tRNA synthetase
LPADSLVQYWQEQKELAHYARACVDLLFKFPFGTQELEGIAARSDFDLSQHQQHSGKTMEVFDDDVRKAATALSPEARAAFLAKVAAEWEARGKSAEAAHVFCEKLFQGKYVPHVIEPSAGVDRLVLALLADAYAEETVTGDDGKSETRTVLRFHPKVAPIKVGVYPLLKNKPELVSKAREVVELLRPHMAVFYDDAGAIGRRYRRMDEIGTPYGVTIDFDTVGENGPEKAGTVTLRHRDSMEQERVSISELLGRLLPQIA